MIFPQLEQYLIDWDAEKQKNGFKPMDYRPQTEKIQRR